MDTSLRVIVTPIKIIYMKIQGDGVERSELYQISSCLRAFDVDRDAAFRALEQLALVYAKAMSSDGDKSSLDEEMEYCFTGIVECLPLFTVAIVGWLTRDPFLGLGRALLQSADVHYLQHSEMLDFNLSSLPVGDALLTGYRLCAYASSPAIALSWIFALHRDFACSDMAQQHSRYLAWFHATEYPVSTRKLASNRAAALATTPYAVEVSNELRQQEESLSAIPSLNELAMTPEMRLTVSSIRRKRSREVTRYSESHSLLATLVTPQYFKYATRTAMTVHRGVDQYETSMEMLSFSLSLELPLSETTDPMRALLTRIQLSKGPR